MSKIYPLTIIAANARSLGSICGFPSSAHVSKNSEAIHGLDELIYCILLILFKYYFQDSKDAICSSNPGVAGEGQHDCQWQPEAA
jgi:hypothetical protein